MPSIKVSMHGPIFQAGLPASVVQDTLRGAVGDLVAEGEREVKLQLYPGHGLKTGHYRRSVHGEVSASLHGRVHDSNVVYGPWLEGVSSRNQKSRFKGYAMFRNATQKLEKLKHATLEKWVKKAMGKLN